SWTSGPGLTTQTQRAMPRPTTQHAVLSLALALAIAACAKDPNYGATPAGTGGTGGTGGSGPPPPVASALPSSLKWTSTGPLITAKQDAKHPIVSVKDPSVVLVDGRWHVFATTANTAGAWSIVYLTFTDWSQADAAPLYYLD